MLRIIRLNLLNEHFVICLNSYVFTVLIEPLRCFGRIFFANAIFDRRSKVSLGYLCVLRSGCSKDEWNISPFGASFRSKPAWLKISPRATSRFAEEEFLLAESNAESAADMQGRGIPHETE